MKCKLWYSKKRNYSDSKYQMFTKSRNKHVAKISCKYIEVCGQAKTKKENGKTGR